MSRADQMAGAGSLPFEGRYQVIQVLFQKIIYDGQGIFIWRAVKIERAA
jgi:hypothetical protein